MEKQKIAANFNYFFLICVFVRTVFDRVECGAFNGRSGGYRSGSQYRSSEYQTGNNYGNYKTNKAQIMNQSEMDQNVNVRSKNYSPSGPGLSAWGLITIIMLIIGIGMGAYYGVICYPLICKEERNYDLMDAASTTASANTPTRSSDFEKSGNYSSRSTTPSVIINS